MKKIKEVLRMKWSCGVSERRIASSCQVARSTVADCIRRAQAAGLSWPLPEEMNDTRLEALLYPPPAPASFQHPLIRDGTIRFSDAFHIGKGWGLRF